MQAEPGKTQHLILNTSKQSQTRTELTSTDLSSLCSVLLQLASLEILSSYFSDHPLYLRKMVGVEDPVNQPGDNVVPVAQPLQDNHRVRVRCTHKDDIISSLLGKLSFHDKLFKNKEIKDQNKNRELKNYNHYLDPIAHPEPGSENASFITIDDAEVKDLKDPSILTRFSNFVPDFLLIHITWEVRDEKEERDKRKLEELNSLPSDLSLEANLKQRRMDGSKAAERVVGSQRDIEFSDILFTTNAHVSIPLPFFCNANLRYIIDHAATLRSRTRTRGRQKASLFLIFRCHELNFPFKF